MKVFLAGATGAVGRPLVRQLIDAGHEVVGMTRREERASWLESAGARAVVGNALDAAWLADQVKRAEPEVLIDQMTDLPQRMRPRGLRRFYRNQSPLREKGSGALLEAAKAVGARRLIAQGVAFIYAPGGGLKREDDPIWRDAPEPAGAALRTAAAHDQRVVAQPTIEGLVLRYGVFYGPGTHFAPGNGFYEDIRRRRMPIVGNGDAVWSFCHVDDAATAAIKALDHGGPGIYNVVDDEPAPTRIWMPEFARAIGAEPPRTVPHWVSRIIAGPAQTAWATRLPGTSNDKARRALDWVPHYWSWRQGFAAEAERWAHENRSA